LSGKYQAPLPPLFSKPPAENFSRNCRQLSKNDHLALATAVIALHGKMMWSGPERYLQDE
jgi:hypothetical protein